MKKFVVMVTKDDIEKGRSGDPSYCPIARAVRRLGFERVGVYYDDIQFGRKKKSIAVPLNAIKFIGAFDAGRKVNPFSFTMEV